MFPGLVAFWEMFSLSLGNECKRNFTFAEVLRFVVALHSDVELLTLLPSVAAALRGTPLESCPCACSEPPPVLQWRLNAELVVLW